jgi:hypothetical protein
VLNKKIKFIHIDQLKTKITMDNIVFEKFEDNDYSGFYDWMRNSMGMIIGVRYTRLAKFKPCVTTALKKLSYLYLKHEQIFEIYFNLDRNYLDDISNDQDNGVCKMYVLGNETYAILLDLLYMINIEFSSIKLG